MKLALEQLTKQLNKQLFPVYLLTGDELLLQQEAVDWIRQAAHAAGYGERKAFEVDAHFDWTKLAEASDNYSLFSEKTLIELRLGQAKLGQSGGKQLKAAIESINQDTIFLLTANKLDASQQKTAWVKAVEKLGGYVAIWPINRQQLPRWIAERLKIAGLTATPEALACMADMTEGNLLATKQVIDVLALTQDKSQIELADVEAVLADDARFDVFELVDTLLLGQQTKAEHMLTRLKQVDKDAVPLIVWALAREFRSLAKMAWQQSQGQSVNQIVEQARVWQKRKPIVTKALNTYTMEHWHRLLAALAEIDAIAKGVKPGDAWFMLATLALGVNVRKC